MASRRSVLAGLFATAVPKPSWASVGSPAYLAAARENDGGFAFFGLSADGQDLFRVTLPARAHAGAGHPRRPEAVLFARRPGTYALVIDCLTGEVGHRLSPPDGVSINGHGAYIEDGDVLVTSEQIAETSAGQIGLWSVREGYRRIGSLPTGGIGPHEVRVMSDGAIVVANGGIATDRADRSKLNVHDMKPSLAIIGTDGPRDLIELPPHLHQASIRHLALGADDQIAFALQWEGDPAELVPLLGLYSANGLYLPDSPEDDLRAMRGYACSVAFDGAGRQVAITSPKGGRMLVYSAGGNFIRSWERADICGLAPCAAGFIATDGGGGLIEYGEKLRALGLRPRAWDNHIVTL